MASAEHVLLSDFIKKTHQDLRNNAKIVGADSAWKQHCANEEVLKQYAGAMQELATRHWQENCSRTDSAAKCRIQWIYDFCHNYFFNGELLRQRSREQDIAKKINLDVKIETTHENILKLLDVGSCYNPFKIFDCFDVLAIDIAPASDDVLRCDFLNLNIVDGISNIGKDNEISVLAPCTFDVVVFSLLLEYLPCPEQRLLCCINAYKLLKTEGVLIIITPDSKHVGANAKFMKSWRYNLAKLGFSRIKYEKLTHIHCMAFRKSIRPEIANRWALLQNEQEFFEEMVIPQDFNAEFDNEVNCNNSTIDLESKLVMLKELSGYQD